MGSAPSICLITSLAFVNLFIYSLFDVYLSCESVFNLLIDSCIGRLEFAVISIAKANPHPHA